jgi:hypothetical protein
VAFGFLMGLVSFHFGLTTVSSCFLIWLETVRDQPVLTLPRKEAPAMPGPSYLGGDQNYTKNFQMASHCSTASGAM